MYICHDIPQGGWSFFMSMYIFFFSFLNPCLRHCWSVLRTGLPMESIVSIKNAAIVVVLFTSVVFVNVYSLNDCPSS